QLDQALATIASNLRRAGNVAVVTHSKPDGDAVGSTLALVRTLLLLGKRAVAVYPPPWQERFDAVVRNTPVVKLQPHHHSVEGAERPDAIVVVDTRAWSQVAEASHWLRENADRVLVVDHHTHSDLDMGVTAAVDPSAAAACMLVTTLCLRLLDLQEPAALPADIAEPLYLGLATDTGWFRHPNVNSDVLALAAGLLRAGADHAKLLRETEQVERPQRLAMMQRALASLELLEQQRVALMSLQQSDFESVGAERDDAGGFVDIPLVVRTVLVSAVLTEAGADQTKLSLRSKGANLASDIVTDVNRIAMTFGGGGHVQAAGALIQAPLREARTLLLQAIRNRS
ncbi:MAG: hypothetical protein D6824_04100, partial [Planctomycetota bacterium]